MDSVFYGSGTKYKVMAHDAVMNPVEAIYGIRKYDRLRGNLFLKGEGDITHCQVMVWEIMYDALENQAEHLVISLGGIDSFDGGAGMLQALGAKFYDDEGEEVDTRQGSRVLKFIRTVDFKGLHPRLQEVRLQLMSDFDSKLYGKHSEIMQIYKNKQVTYTEAVEIDNLIWYFSEIVKRGS